MVRYITIIVFVALFTSCSDYQRVVKSEDVSLKTKTAEVLYKEGKYKKALKLYEQIIPSVKGKPQAERIMFYLADTYYQLGDHYLAGYQFERFAKSYPKSQKGEEAAFKSAKSYYELSPVYSKDQKETNEAINKLQSFINKYPESEYVVEANKLTDELNKKLEQKYYEIAKQYHHREDYKEAIVAFDNYVLDYPGSPYREAALYYKSESAYLLAVNSLPALVNERLQTAQTYYKNYKKYYKEGEYGAKTDKALDDISERLKS